MGSVYQIICMQLICNIFDYLQDATCNKLIMANIYPDIMQYIFKIVMSNCETNMTDFGPTILLLILPISEVQK